MISAKTHSKEWLEEKKRQFPKRDPALIEKVIKALTLVEQLKTCGVNFVFKGGTSLVLLLSAQRRFSIDIDILTKDSSEKLEGCLKEVIKLGVFKSYEEDVRSNSRDIPKRHYKLFYDSIVSPKESTAILLDVLLEEPHYSRSKEIAVESPFLHCEGEVVHVTVPCVDSILGDKLTAFAPNTTGILYGCGKSLEIAKQLFDLGHLFDDCADLTHTKATHQRISKIELGYRKLGAEVDVLEDSFRTAEIISHKGQIEGEKFKELEEGVKKLTNFIIGGRFVIDDAIGSASRVAYLSELLRTDIRTPERYERSIDLTSTKIEPISFNKFNRLKSYRLDAFFYWHQAILLRSKRGVIAAPA